MPKIEIDYSNTIIYKITCKDPNISDVYVGHTTNFVQRKHAHKQSCINNKAPNHTCKLYEAIRNNGGWINWNMEIIHFCNCADHYEARKKEQEYFELLKATLNSLEPFPKPKVKIPTAKIIKEPKEIFYCEKCNIKCDNAKLLAIHNQTKKHNNINMIVPPVTKCAKTYKFNCTICDIKTNNKKDYVNHLLTSKHIKNENLTNMNANITINPQPATYVCTNCNKIYKSRVGLWSHKKKCTILNQEETSAIKEKECMTLKMTDIQNAIPHMDMNLIFAFMKDTQEFKQIMVEQHNTIMEQRNMMEQNKQMILNQKMILGQNKLMVDLVKKLTIPHYTK